MLFSWNEIYKNRLIYEDEFCFALDKPSGISVTGERDGPDLVSLAKDENEKIIPVHRIDKITSGVILFARDSKSHSPLTRQFTKREVKKQYLAVVVGSGLLKKFEIDLPLFTASSGRVRVGADRENIKFKESTGVYKVKKREVFSDKKIFDSKTHAELLGSKDNLSAISLEPISGRRHQIRVHLAWIGFPILGDPLFKSTSLAKTYTPRLHAHCLEINLPWSDGQMLIKADPPADFFENIIKFPA